MEEDTNIINWEQDFFVRHIILSTVKREEFVSDRMSYIVLRGRWWNIIVLNADVPSPEKSNDSKDSFGEELKQVPIIILCTIQNLM
jgi:hypothetical protein